MADRDVYVQKLKSKLDEWNADIDRLEARAKGARDSVKADVQQFIGEVRERSTNVEKKLKELQQSMGDAWTELREGLDEAGEELGESIKKARNKLGSHEGGENQETGG